MENYIFSPGKLLLTSEYFVLDGALALAVPTKLGQDLFWEEFTDNSSIIYWEAYHQNQLWLTAKIDYKEWCVVETNLPEGAAFILKVLKEVQKLSQSKFHGDNGYRFKTQLQFPSNYGLGSSSTLMNNLATFAEIDAFELNEKTLGGSGYDIAVAQENSAILYQNNPRTIEQVTFNPPFLDQLILIHLNQKQDSREGINAFKVRDKSLYLSEDFTKITQQVFQCNNLDEFSELMSLHERLLSNFLGMVTVKEKHFKDCPVFVKSLGAWGGDFILSAKFGDYQQYFSDKGFPHIFDYSTLVKT